MHKMSWSDKAIKKFLQLSVLFNSKKVESETESNTTASLSSKTNSSNN